MGCLESSITLVRKYNGALVASYNSKKKRNNEVNFDMEFNTIKMQELMQIYDKKLATPDPPHGYLALWTDVTADWIKSLNGTEREYIFEYISYILNRVGYLPQKTMTLMMLLKLPCSETKRLMDKMIEEGTSKHTKMDIEYALKIKKDSNL